MTSSGRARAPCAKHLRPRQLACQRLHTRPLPAPCSHPMRPPAPRPACPGAPAGCSSPAPSAWPAGWGHGVGWPGATGVRLRVGGNAMQMRGSAASHGLQLKPTTHTLPRTSPCSTSCAVGLVKGAMAAPLSSVSATWCPCSFCSHLSSASAACACGGDQWVGAAEGWARCSWEDRSHDECL